MPEAHVILLFLGTFMGLWGLSLIVRGVAGERTGSRRACPACRAALAPGVLVCAACAYECRSEAEARERVPNWLLAVFGLTVTLSAAGALFAADRVYVWTHRNPLITAGFAVWDSLALATFAFALCLTVWAVRGDRSRGRRRCPACWYDLSGLDAMRCPECGRDASHTREFYRPRRRWRWAAAGVVLVIGAGATTGWPRYREGGVPALVPTTALVAGMWRLPEPYVLGSPAGSRRGSSLLTRVDSGTMWQWQVKWLRSRANAMLAAPTDPESLNRAVYLCEGLRLEDFARVKAVIARWIAGTDADLQSRATRAIAPNTWFGYGNAEPVAIAPLEPGLRAALSSPDPMVALLAADLLAVLPGDHTDIARRVIQIAVAAKPAPQQVGAWVLARLASPRDAASVRATAVQWLGSSDAVERTVAADALREQASHDESVAAAFRQRLTDRDAHVAATAAEALCNAKLPGAAKAAAEAVVSATDTRARLRMLAAIEQCPDQFADIVPVLIPVLTNESNSDILAATAEVLEAAAVAGHDISAALPVLDKLKQVGDAQVVTRATSAIWAEQQRASKPPK